LSIIISQKAASAAAGSPYGGQNRYFCRPHNLKRGKNDMFKFQVTLDRQSAKYCLLPNTPHFLLLSTFKGSRPDRRKNLFGFLMGSKMNDMSKKQECKLRSDFTSAQV
jgi:hypothetical protein